MRTVGSVGSRRVPRISPGSAGTTIRVYDPRLGAWRVTWNGVLTGTVLSFVARQQAGEIVRGSPRSASLPLRARSSRWPPSARRERQRLA